MQLDLDRIENKARILGHRVERQGDLLIVCTPHQHSVYTQLGKLDTDEDLEIDHAIVSGNFIIVEGDSLDKKRNRKELRYNIFKASDNSRLLKRQKIIKVVKDKSERTSNQVIAAYGVQVVTFINHDGKTKSFKGMKRTLVRPKIDLNDNGDERIYIKVGAYGTTAGWIQTDLKQCNIPGYLL